MSETFTDIILDDGRLLKAKTLTALDVFIGCSLHKVPTVGIAMYAFLLNGKEITLADLETMSAADAVKIADVINLQTNGLKL